MVTTRTEFETATFRSKARCLFTLERIVCGISNRQVSLTRSVHRLASRLSCRPRLPVYILVNRSVQTHSVTVIYQKIVISIVKLQSGNILNFKFLFCATIAAFMFQFFVKETKSDFLHAQHECGAFMNHKYITWFCRH